VVLTVVRKDVETPLTFTLTREEINVKSVRAKMLEPATATCVSARSRSAPARTWPRAEGLLRKGELKGLVLDVRSDPGGLLNQAVAVSAAFLPKDALVVYTDGRTPDARMRLLASKDNYSRRGDDYFKDLPAAVKKVPMVVLVDGGTASASRSSRARCRTTSARRDRHPDVRQGIGADDSSARQQRRAEAHDGALLHAGGPFDPGQGIEPDISVDDGRESRIDRKRTSNATWRPPRRRGQGDAVRRPPSWRCRRSSRRPQQGEVAPLLPRFEFGADDDFQLQQAMNHLKGAPVIASTKAVAANTAVPTAVKP
jgi:carboxyl-terminal processing protease